MALFALGLIETRSKVGAITAANAVQKISGLQIKGKHSEDSITVFFEGEISAVKNALEVAANCARKMDQLRYYHVVPNPHPLLKTILYNNENEL